MKHTLTACLLGLISLASLDASAQIRRTSLVLDDGSGNFLTILPPVGMSGNMTWAVPASTSGIAAGTADGQIAWWDNTAGSWKPTSNILLTNTTGALQLGAASVAGSLSISDGAGSPKYAKIVANGSMSATPTTLTLPASSGTIALLSDITSGTGDVVAANTNTFTNTNTFSSASPTKLTNAAPVITLGTTPTNATLTIKDGEAVPNTLLTLTDNGTNGTLTVANFSGNLSGNVTGDVTGNVSGNAGGNAATATKLQTARTIAGTSFDGTTNISIDANNLSGSTLNSGVTASSLTSVGTITSGTWNGTAVTADHGGTGQTSLTQYSVLLGNGTSAVANAAPSTAGQALISNGASSNPSFQSIPVQSYVSGNSANTNLTNNAVTYWPIGGAFTAYTTAASCPVYTATYACKIKNLFVAVNGGAGASPNAWTIDVYDVTTNTAGPSVNISGSAVTGTDLSTTLSVAAGDKIVLRVSPTSSPTAKPAMWSFEIDAP